MSNQALDDRVLKACNQIESCRARKSTQHIRASFAASESLLACINLRLQFRALPQIVENRSLDSAETEIALVAAHLGLVESHRGWIPVHGQFVNYRTAGISEGEHSRDFVVSFARRVIARSSNACIGKLQRAVSCGVAFCLHAIEQRVSARHN